MPVRACVRVRVCMFHRSKFSIDPSSCIEEAFYVFPYTPTSATDRPGGALQTSLSSAPAGRRVNAARNREIFINFVFLLVVRSMYTSESVCERKCVAGNVYTMMKNRYITSMADPSFALIFLPFLLPHVPRCVKKNCTRSLSRKVFTREMVIFLAAICK